MIRADNTLIGVEISFVAVDKNIEMDTENTICRCRDNYSVTTYMFYILPPEM